MGNMIESEEKDMGIPEIIFLAIYAINLLYAIVNHGKACRYAHNAYASAIGTAIGISLLYFGGFFA